MLSPGGALQAVTTISSFGASGKPLWLMAVEVVAFVAGAAIVGTLFTRLVTSIAARAGAHKGVVHTTRQWLSVLIIIGTLAGVAYLTGLSTDITTLTISGIAGLAVSLALQNTLSNIIAGVLLLNDGVIRLGDDIQYGGPGGVRGEVVKLSLRTTWLRTQDGVITVIGNGNLSAGPILNYSARPRLEKKLSV
ncbi:MAG: mechanosensitive ion channel [Nitrososphaerota archaeon]|nr:mechanosensitive ion channel [Nitrososphaerota archaeon]